MGLDTTGIQQSTAIFSGTQRQLFSPGLSIACDAALNGTMGCPLSIQFLYSPSQLTMWNTTGLNELCTSACQTDLSSLIKNVTKSCGSESIRIAGKNMTWASQMNYVQSQYNFVCMKDTNSLQFCSDVENNWNITTMMSQGKATWPQNTKKCYTSLSEGELSWVTDSQGDCTSDGIANLFSHANAYKQSVANNKQAFDYYYNRTAMIADDNYGWPTALEYDEYPLEIQCSSCWINKFIATFQDAYGSSWTDITAQVWSNMQKNCGINQTITPYTNLSVFDPNFVIQTVPDAVVDMSKCGQILRPHINGIDCQIISQRNSVATAAVRALNPFTYCEWLETTQSLCAPLSCNTTVNEGSITNAFNFAAQYTNFTYIQFISWNRFIDRSIVLPGDAVCVGPVGGAYALPTPAKQANPSVFSTTAHPSEPTPSGSITNCGLWYKVQQGDSCNMLAMRFSLTFSQLVNMNPSLDSSCSNLQQGYDYCMAAVNGTIVKSVTMSAALLRQPHPP